MSRDGRLLAPTVPLLSGIDTYEFWSAAIE
jgi:hypothetical protein